MHEAFEITAVPTMEAPKPTILTNCGIVFGKFFADITPRETIPGRKGHRWVGIDVDVRVEEGDPRYAPFSKWLEEQWRIVSGELADCRETDDIGLVQAGRRVGADTVIDGFMRTRVGQDQGLEDIRISKTSKSGRLSSVVMRGYPDEDSMSDRGFSELTANQNWLEAWDGTASVALTSRNLRIIAHLKGLTFQFIGDSILVNRGESLAKLAMLGRAWERWELQSKIQDSA